MPSYHPIATLNQSIANNQFHNAARSRYSASVEFRQHLPAAC